MRIWSGKIRLLATTGLAVCVASGAIRPNETPWELRLVWGDSIPAGTVYTITLDNTGALEAERKGLPFTDQGLTVIRHQGKLRPDTTAAIRSTAEGLIRGVDPSKIQGQMRGDGGFVKLEIWEGTVLFAVQLSHLSSWDEAGEAWLALLSTVRTALPADFIE